MLQRLPRPHVLFLLGALLFVVGAKLCLIRSFGSDVPLADQWAAEGSTLFQPQLQNGCLPVERFFFPHGEHRPAMTRFWAYLLFRLDGDQWDARLEAVANLVFHAGTLLVLWSVAARFAQGGLLVAARVCTIILCALPSIHENFVWGFQSQFLLLILCGLAHVAGTLATDRPGWRWWLAQLVGLAGLLSLSSGFLSAVVLAGLALVELVRGRRDPWAWCTLASNVALVAFGVWFLNPIVEATDHAHSVGDLAKAMVALLSWPFPQAGWGLLSHLPLFVVTGYALFRRTEVRLARLALALGAWLWLLMAALAYGRGGGSDGIMVATRYMDILVIACWLNLMTVFWFGRLVVSRRLWLAIGTSGLCLVPMLAGLAYWNRPAEIRATAEKQRPYMAQHDATVREFLRTDDAAVFERDPAIRQAFPHLSFTIDLLRDPVMRPALPASLQPDGRAGALSRGALAVVRGAPFILGVGFVLIALSAGLSFWSRSRSLTP